MLNFVTMNSKVVKIDEDYHEARAFVDDLKLKNPIANVKVENCHSLTSYSEAVELADSANKFDPENTYLPVDKGSGIYPRFNVIVAPKVGEPVSKALNGDYYPVGEIVSVSKTFKKVTTSTGDSFYRVRKSSTWRMHGVWSLVSGHVERQNPHF